MRRVFWLALSFAVIAFPSTEASDARDQQQTQDQQASQDSGPQAPKQKPKKKASAKLAKESDPYRTWLTEKVSYIITDEEKAAFLRLTTNEEREQFRRCARFPGGARAIRARQLQGAAAHPSGIFRGRQDGDFPATL